MGFSTVGSGKDYDNLTAWHTGITTGTPDATETALCSGAVGGVTINGYGTDTGTIIIQPEGSSDRHDGTSVTSGTYATFIHLSDNVNITLQILEMGIYSNSDADDSCLYQSMGATNDQFIIDGCFVHLECNSAPTGVTPAIFFSDFSTTQAQSVQITNNIVIAENNGNGSGAVQGIKINDGDGPSYTHVAYNTVVLSTDVSSANNRGIYTVGGGTALKTFIESNAVFLLDEGNSCFSLNGTPTSNNNVSSDATGEITNKAIASCVTNGTSSPYDFTPVSSGPLDEAGNTASVVSGGTGLLWLATDALDNTRPVNTFEVGAVELQLGGFGYNDRNRTVKGARPCGILGRSVPFDRS